MLLQERDCLAAAGAGTAVSRRHPDRSHRSILLSQHRVGGILPLIARRLFRAQAATCTMQHSRLDLCLGLAQEGVRYVATAFQHTGTLTHLQLLWAELASVGKVQSTISTRI